MGENQNRFVRDRSLWTVSGSGGAFAASAARAAARARETLSTSAAPTFRSAANETGLPTLAGGLGWGSFAFAEPEAIVRHSHSRSVPSFDDDSHRSRDEKNDEGDGSGRDGRGARDSEGDFTEGVFTGEDEDRIEDVSAEYDFPSPAPSAAAAFIGLSRTSPASAYSAYSAYSENGSAPPTPPQFALKGGLSELERALVSGATVAFRRRGRSFAVRRWRRWRHRRRTRRTLDAEDRRSPRDAPIELADAHLRRRFFRGARVERSGSARIRARIGLGGGLRGGLRGGFFRRI